MTIGRWNTNCTGYRDYACGVALTKRNRSARVGGRCIACGLVFALANYHYRKHGSVPEHVHARARQIAAQVAAGTYVDTPGTAVPARAVTKKGKPAAPPRLSHNEAINERRVPMLEARAPWRCGPFSLTAMAEGAALRFGDGDDDDECVAVLLEAAQLTDLAVWFVAACRRQGAPIGAALAPLMTVGKGKQ